MARRCSTCPHSVCGSYDSLSDICDGCRSDADTGWYGSTDYSVEDEDGNPCYYTNEKEHRSYMELLDWDW